MNKLGLLNWMPPEPTIENIANAAQTYVAVRERGRGGDKTLYSQLRELVSERRIGGENDELRVALEEIAHFAADYPFSEPCLTIERWAFEALEASMPKGKQTP